MPWVSTRLIIKVKFEQFFEFGVWVVISLKMMLQFLFSVRKKINLIFRENATKMLE